MPFVARLILALILVAIAAFCAFGFLATFEPPGPQGLRIAYGILGLLCLVGAGRLLLARRPVPSSDPLGPAETNTG